MSRRRVLIAAHFYPPHHGGIEIVAQHEADGLHARGWDVTVLTSAADAPSGLRNEDGVHVRRVRAWTGLVQRGVPFPVFAPALLWHAWRGVRRADVAHVHDVLYLTSWVVAALCRLLGRPYVVSLHVATVFHPSAVVRLVQASVRRLGGRLVLGGAAAVFAIDEEVAADGRRLHPSATVRVLRNGVDTDTFRPVADAAERAALRAALGLPADEVLALFVGRFVPKKGYDVLAALRPRGVRLVFVGGDRPAGFDGPHLFLGALPQQRLAEVYRCVDLFVGASVGEGPMTVLEALASGTPVLLHDDPGARSLALPDTAVTYADLWTDPLAIEHFAADTKRRLAQSGHARQSVLDRGWGPHIDHVGAAYTRVLGRDRRLRVALVAPYVAPRIGGVESYVAQLVGALQRSPDHDVVVIAAADGRRTHTSIEAGVPVIRLGTWLRLSNTPIGPLWAWQVRRALTSYDVDLVNAHSPVPYLADVAVAVAGPRPVVLTYHAGSLVKGSSRVVDTMLRAYERRILPRVFARADRLVAVSSTALSAATGRAALLPPGVDIARFTPGAPTRDERVVYVGRIEFHSRWKGIAGLLEAFALVAAERPGACLQLVGDGDDVPRLKALATSLGLADRVTWRGSLSGQDLVDAYRSAAVVVLPSLSEAESFGMTLIEAMACGVPVVGSAVGGIGSVIRHDVDGLLVPPGDATALAGALTGLLADPARRAALGAEGRRQAETHWSWTHTIDATLALFDEAAGRRA